MQGLLGDKFGSQTTFDDGQRSLIKTLERYYFTVSDDEIAYISSSDGKVYLKNGLLFSIKDGFINSIKDLNVGSEYYLEPNNIYFHKYVDRNNNVEYWMNEGNITNVDIYDSSNLNSYQYGGNQMSFFYHSQDLLNDPYILNNLRSYFPDASMDDYELYLNKLSIKGCGYASTANAIFNQYTGNEQQFLKDFGFPMYSIRDDGSLDYNYEYLMLDFFNYRNIRTGLNIQQLYGNISKTATGEIIEVGFSDVDALGFDNNSYASIKTYLKDRYNIDIRLDERYLNSDLNKDFINSENSFEYDDVVSAYYDIKNDNNTVILGAGNFKLLNMDGSVNLENGDGHCMTITGVTDDGNFIVSSWGEQHIIDIKGTQANGGNIDIHAITFE